MTTKPLIVASAAMAADRPLTLRERHVDHLALFGPLSSVSRDGCAGAGEEGDSRGKSEQDGIEFSAAIVYIIRVGPWTPGGNGSSSRASP